MSVYYINIVYNLLVIHCLLLLIIILGNSLTAAVCGGAVLRPTLNQESIDMLEYPFLTIVKFPPGFILHLGKHTQKYCIFLC